MLRDAHGIHIDVDDAVVTITFDRPDHRNALSDPVLARLAEILECYGTAPSCRCIVLAGSDKVFASGADVTALLSRTALEAYEGSRTRSWEAIRRVRTPMIAAVSGFCLGAGCELALMSDIVVASETTRFGLPETGLGLIPGAGGTQMLPRAIGKALTMDMVLTGRLLSAQEAERAGLVSRVTASDDWRQTARAIADEVAGRSAVAQRLAKGAVNDAFETPLQAGIAAERRAFAVAFASDDAREGLSAFVEKREPVMQHH